MIELLNSILVSALSKCQQEVLELGVLKVKSEFIDHTTRRGLHPKRSQDQRYQKYTLHHHLSR